MTTSTVCYHSTDSCWGISKQFYPPLLPYYQSKYQHNEKKKIRVFYDDKKRFDLAGTTGVHSAHFEKHHTRLQIPSARKFICLPQ